ncbi:MAG: hypothetical protein PHP65_06365, partial [Bacilli bacterium]|nr:hypothetical protein [Bacilli bacterium]
MKNNKIFLVLFLFILGFVFVGCNEPEIPDDEDDPIIPTLSVSTETVSLEVEETQQITATIGNTTEVLTAVFTS